jgi:hypothetical protein
MSIFVEIDQGNPKRLVRMSVLSNSNTLWDKREDWGHTDAREIGQPPMVREECTSVGRPTGRKTKGHL